VQPNQSSWFQRVVRNNQKQPYSLISLYLRRSPCRFTQVGVPPERTKEKYKEAKKEYSYATLRQKKDCTSPSFLAAAFRIPNLLWEKWHRSFWHKTVLPWSRVKREPFPHLHPPIELYSHSTKPPPLRWDQNAVALNHLIYR
jgi:hypothetical protein